MQDAVDMDGGDRRTLQRRQQDAAQGVAEREAKAELQRAGDDGREALRVIARDDFKLVGLGELLPIFLNHERAFLTVRRRLGARTNC